MHSKRKYGYINVRLLKAVESLDEGRHKDFASHCLGAFFARSYWRRVWIVQEVINGRIVQVHCGSKCVPWAMVGELFDIYIMTEDFEFGTAEKVRHIHRQAGGPDIWQETPEGAGTNMESILYSPPFQGLSNIVLQRFHHQSSNLQELIELYDQLDSTDIRDRVYGLVGLANDCTSSMTLNVDYTVTATAVFHETMRFCKPPNAIEFGSILLDALKLRSSLPEMRHADLTNDSAEHLVEFRYIGKITKKCEAIHEDPSGSPIYCFDFSRPERDLRRTSPIHFYEHDMFLKGKHCQSHFSAEIGDRVYWVALTRHTLICRTSSRPRSLWKRLRVKDSYIPKSRAALVPHHDFKSATACLDIKLNCLRVAPDTRPLEGLSVGFGYLVGTQDLLNMLQGELPLTEEEYVDAKRKVMLSQFHRAF